MATAKEIIITADGSESIRISGTDVAYHSQHGALAESRHIFISQGLRRLLELRDYNKVRILEIGFGTGLNALLTAFFATDQQQQIHYTTLEPYPLEEELWHRLHYGGHLGNPGLFRQLHEAPWEEDVPVHSFFTLHKKQSGIMEAALQAADLVYFDAFGPEDQPELWTAEVFRKIFALMNPGALLVTYCAKGAVRRLMQDCGLITERIAGPPGGKREILRAGKAQ